MTPHDQPDQQVDHVAEAERWVDAAECEANDERDPQIAAAFASVANANAAIALAQELRGIREALEGLSGQLGDVIDPTATPSFPGVVRVRIEATDA